MNNETSHSKSELALRGMRITTAFLVVFEVLIFSRLLLKFLGISPNVSFVSAIYDITSPFVDSFTFFVPSAYLTNNAILEWSAIIAMAVYWLFFFMLFKVFDTREERRKENRMESIWD